ncbi:hypothetical protein GWK47_019823 [Chionoecetes opilio]|uniref:Uncharacterized protein n=1 Tax=Chionoecetes opilio TaxID=41210 RepID=A0A8J4XTU1_CHIOP|nr:hypothetical protein GWK47_019823 [Chionoecetes opilio]
MFHSFTGCDTTSAFFGKGEEISMGGLESLRGGLTEAFNNFMNHPYMTVTVNCKQFHFLERFTVIIYNKNEQLGSVNEARRELRELFSKENRPMERFPQRKKPFCSTHCAQSPKLESGQPVINVSDASNPRGLWMDSRECNEDLASLWCPTCL